MKAQIRRVRDNVEMKQAEPDLVWLWTESDPDQAQPGGWYLVLENCALAIRVLISAREPREAAASE
jgi:hypothetical protein